MKSTPNRIIALALLCAGAVQASEYVYYPTAPSGGNFQIDSTSWLVDGGETPQVGSPAGSGNTMTFSDLSFEANEGNNINIWTSAAAFELAEIKVSASSGTAALYNFNGDNSTPSNAWNISSVNMGGGANLTIRNWAGKTDAENNLATLSIDSINPAAGNFSVFNVQDINAGSVSEIASGATLSLKAKGNLLVESNLSNSGSLTLQADTLALGELSNSLGTASLSATGTANLQKLSILDGTVYLNNLTSSFDIGEAVMKGGVMNINASGGGSTNFEKLTIESGPLYLSGSALVGGSANMRVGELNMTGGYLIVSRENVANSYVEIGGLSGTGGQITTWNNENEGTSATVIFNSDGGNHTASGVKFADNFQANGATSVMSIVKEGTSRQVLSFAQNSISGSVDVKNGTLLLNNASKLASVTLNGGMFGSAGQKLQISKLNLNGGKLLFDFSLAQNESSLELAFDSASDFSDTVTESDFAFSAINGNFKYLLISFADSSMNSKLQEIVDSDANGKYLFTDAATAESFYATFSAENGALYVSFAAVPEPAAYAAALGLAALLWALRRRK